MVGQPETLLQVFVPQHPLIGHWLAVCRNKLSPPPIFRSAVAELGRILIYEASQGWLPVAEGQVETPLAIADCRYVDHTQPVKVSLPHLPTQYAVIQLAKSLSAVAMTF